MSKQIDSKQKILDQLIQNVSQELTQLQEAYKSTQELIQSGDLKSDGKYDTRGTEANYLANGQRQRITQLEQEIELLDSVEIKAKKSSISIGTLAEIKLNGHIRKYFIAPTSGGTMVRDGEDVVLVISVFSPIGDRALGLRTGDLFELELKGQVREYEVEGFY